MATVSGTELDPAAAAWLRRVLPGHRITAAEPLGGGYRNENIRLVTDSGSYVLRRYLRGDAARTCAIEAALAARLAAEAVPAAEVIAADPGGAAAGLPLLLARHVPGVMVSEAVARDPAAAAGIGAAAGRALAATVAELIGPDQVQPEPGYAQQGCLPVGAYREVTGAVTAGSIHIDVDVRVTAYAAAVPTTKADACTPTPISCDLSPLPGGRTLARYELTDNLHVDLYYGPHVVVALVALPTGNGNGYGFSPAEWRAIVSDPRLVAVARQVTTA